MYMIHERQNDDSSSDDEWASCNIFILQILFCKFIFLQVLFFQLLFYVILIFFKL